MRYKTVWLSDIHLGFKDCRAEYLLDFLAKVECDSIYLIGDVIDLWAMKRSLFWPSSHYDVLRSLFNKANAGTRIVYIPGNHDEPFRDYVGNIFGPIEIRKDAVYTTVKGKRLLMFHGDCLDEHIQLRKWENLIGDAAYDLLLFLNRWANFFRRRSGRHYWSLATYIKQRIPNARQVIEVFEQAAVQEAAARNLDGVICGHIHQPALKEIDGLLYCNDGDWIENCTVLTEDDAGNMELLQWTEKQTSLDKWLVNETPAQVLPLRQAS
ncbi:UDP-2,3-diacylglucosamine diphosphatase [Spongiibacter sp. KMU-166]|uniref:UDP-2,3-diacylglucosamine diphosphatase n=1 Tax=Spongiibacter thalassae TaxID=2721624 RepID=A0ABX1GFN5_9GAMM|nr:UDP-2,3-diacylglucosamine diphosphatase [Spongiibacter thalassae]